MLRRLPRVDVDRPRQEIVKREAEPALHPPRQGVHLTGAAEPTFAQRQLEAERLARRGRHRRSLGEAHVLQPDPADAEHDLGLAHRPLAVVGRHDPRRLALPQQQVGTPAQQVGAGRVGGQIEHRSRRAAVVPGPRRPFRPEQPQRRQSRRVADAEQVAQRRGRAAGVEQVAHLKSRLERPVAQQHAEADEIAIRPPVGGPFSEQMLRVGQRQTALEAAGDLVHDQRHGVGAGGGGVLDHEAAQGGEAARRRQPVGQGVFGALEQGCEKGGALLPEGAGRRGAGQPRQERRILRDEAVFVQARRQQGPGEAQHPFGRRAVGAPDATDHPQGQQRRRGQRRDGRDRPPGAPSQATAAARAAATNGPTRKSVAPRRVQAHRPSRP